jgi:hypothetical protein
MIIVDGMAMFLDKVLEQKLEQAIEIAMALYRQPIRQATK